jgi:hypothetical protein
MMQITVMVAGSCPCAVVSVRRSFTFPPQKLGGSWVSNTIPQPYDW